MTIRITSLFIVFIVAISYLGAQKIDSEQLKGLKIRNIGPAGMSGRVTAIDVDLSNPDIIYAGTASGGVWKSASGGIAWEPIFDDAPTQSVGAVAVNQSNPAEIWVGTGEGNPRNSANSGAGIFKTIDGGKTWKRMGLKATKTIHRIIVHRDNPDIVYVGATGSAWGPSPERGVFKTTDGGKTWKKVLYINDETGCADLVVDPSNPNKLIAAMWEHGRLPWTFNSGGKGSGIYISYDGGESWKKRTAKDGLPKGDLGRIGLAIAPSKPNIVYALVEAKKNGLYKSTDGGHKWTLVSEKNIGNRPFYYADIYVDPLNENRIYNLFSLVTRSEDGGKTFKTLLPYSGVHPDHHAFWIHPTNPNYLIEGNDGGMNISRDGGDNWEFIDNLPLAQFYHISYDMSIPYLVAGGMQDNGSWVGPSSTWKRGGIRNYDWQEVYFGDGFDVLFNPDDSRYVYAMSQGGNVGYMDRETGKNRFIKPVHPDGTPLRFHWNAGIAQNPFHNSGIYFGSQFVHKSMDYGKTWEIISPDLTTNDTLKQQQSKSGGLTIDDTQAENHTTILAIAPSPVDEQVIWVGTDDGNLQLTRDGGKNWTNLGNKLSAAKAGSWIPYIEVSQKNAGEAFVIINDYRRNDWRPMAYHTKDYGATFRRIVTEKQVEGHALAIVQDPEVENLLWLGTDFGLYFSIDSGNNWNKWMNDYPSVSTIDLKIHPREHDLIVGTFGRAAWILDDIRPIREIARTKGKVLQQDFKVFEAPDAYLATYRSVDGVRFTSDGTFVGENKRRGAMLTVWLNPDTKKEKKTEETTSQDKKKGKKADKKKDVKKATVIKSEMKDKMSNFMKGKGKGKMDKKKVKIQVFNSDKDTLRTFSMPIDTGMNRVYWGLNQDGVRFPSRRPVKPGDNTPGGNAVLPGTYKVVMTYGEQRDSTNVTVHGDPRLDISTADRQAKAAVQQEFEGIIKKATEGFGRLQDTRKTIKLVESSLVNAPDSTKKELKEMSKALLDSIATLENLYMFPKDTKGYTRDPSKINSTLFQTWGYVRSGTGASGQSAQIMLQRSKEKVQGVLERINALMAGEFADYQKAVEAVQYSLFKSFEPIRME